MKKFIVCAVIFCITAVSMMACTQSAVTSMDTIENPDNAVLHDTIDTSFDAVSGTYVLPGIGLFKIISAPGMLLYTDQTGGATLAYINKATNRSFYFCMDPTCTHSGSCPANVLHLTNNMVYCNGKIYAVAPDPRFGTNGTVIYSVELDATGLKECYTGDGNMVKDLLAYHDMILFTQAKTDGGGDFIVYNTTTGKSKCLSQNFKLELRTYFTANDSIYYTFIGDTYLYRTDDFFATSKKLFDIEKISNLQYGDATHLYGTVYQKNDDGTVITRAIIRCSLEDGMTETVYDSGGDDIYFSGIDDTYCYYYPVVYVETPYKRSYGTPIINSSGGILYRIPKAGGDSEMIIDNINYKITYVQKYGEKLYVLGEKYSPYKDFGISTTFIGILEDGVIEEIKPR